MTPANPESADGLRRARRNVLLLALCQALFMSGTSMVLTVTALAGTAIAPVGSLGTLPLSLQFVATMLTTVPASLLMRRYGRRTGFLAGALVGMLGAAISFYALVKADFPLFAFGAALIGVLNGFAIYYRFAAADTADASFRPKAISLVMAGGVLAAFIGPNLAKLTVEAFPGASYAGCFAALVGLHTLTILLLSFIDIPTPPAAGQKNSGASLGHILRRPALVVAMLAAVAGYSSMNLVMTATPLSMVGHDFAFSDAAMVIQWHIFAMFAPSFVTGHLISRFGHLNVIMAGAALILLCVAINLGGTSLYHYLLALMALGVGWNFMYVGGSALLTTAHEPTEKAKVQGLNEFLVFGAVALASFASGAVQHGLGWLAVNLIVLPLTILALAVTAWLKLAEPVARAPAKGPARP
jgi:MFS family permease